jgi:BNR repeat protein
MMQRSQRLVRVGVCVAAAAAAVAAMSPEGAGQGKRSRRVRPEVVAATAVQPAAAPGPGTSGFAPQTRLGFHVGDQWEPALAADGYGSVYVLYPQYDGVPGCEGCASPTAILQVSRDRGATWDSPRPIAPSGTEQVDTQIAVDPVDGRTLYAAWLQDGKSDIAVARSTDLGHSWTVVVADATNAGTDKPILAVRGPDVYVAYNHAQKVWVSTSHDGGATFTTTNVNPNGKLGWSLAGGGTVTPDGAVYFSWAGYEQNGGAKGKVNLYVSKSTDGGATWTNLLLDVSAAPPDCSAYLCGWAYLGAQATLASDAAGTLYALWNSGTLAKGPERIYFARSHDGAATWSGKVDVSRAPAGSAHAFPAIAAAGAGDVRISWMDARQAPLWNVYYRRSTDGGARFTAEVDLSTFVAGFSYIQPGGFGYPFGDYYEMDIDDRGDSQLVWGEGLNWLTPGSIWYTRGR